MTAAPDARDLGAGQGLRNVDARRDTMSAAEHLQQAVQNIERRRDQVSVLAAESLARESISGYLREVEEATGMHAQGATERSTARLDEIKARAAEQLTNGRQTHSFNTVWERLRLQTIDAISRHESREGQKAKAETAAAWVAGAIEWASRNADNPDALASSRDDVIGRTGLMASANGWSREVRAVKLVEHLSQLHEGVVNARLTRGDVAGAREYYDAHALNEMNASTRERLGKTLQTAGSIEAAQAFADGVDGMPEAEAISKARKELSGDAEQRAVAEIKTRNVERNAARERLQRSAADQAWSIYSQSQNPSSIPPAVWSLLDGRDQQAILRTHEQRLASEESRAAAREGRAAARETRAAAAETRENASKDRDRAGVYYDLRSLAMTDPSTFAQIDLRRYTADLGSATMESLIDLQSQIAKPTPQDPTSLDLKTYLQQVRSMTTKLSLSKEKTAEFESQADQAVRAAQVRAGRKLSETERQEVLDRLIVETAVPGTFFGTNQTPTWRVTEDQAKALASDRGVPAAAVDQIIAGLRKRGLPVTGEAIERVYRSAVPPQPFKK